MEDISITDDSKQSKKNPCIEWKANTQICLDGKEQDVPVDWTFYTVEVSETWGLEWSERCCRRFLGSSCSCWEWRGTTSPIPGPVSAFWDLCSKRTCLTPFSVINILAEITLSCGMGPSGAPWELSSRSESGGPALRSKLAGWMFALLLLLLLSPVVSCELQPSLLMAPQPPGSPLFPAKLQEFPYKPPYWEHR